MELRIDEQEQNHIYSCLLVGNAEFGKVKKSLAKLNREDDQIDEEITLNAKLRRIFNPNAEEEARERARSKDPAQMDLTEAGSSGETGGGIPAGQTFKLKTPADMTNEELRDALLELGLAVQLDTIEAWVDDDWERDVNAVESWIEQSRAAVASGEPLPDEPMLLARDAMPVSRLQELLAAGPWRAQENPSDDVGGTVFNVIRNVDDMLDVDSSTDDKLDAEIRAARLNRGALLVADMSDDEVLEWSAKGPWSVAGDGDGEGDNFWHIVAGTQREECESELDAIGRAARYNRSIAQQATEALDISVASDDAEEIVAAGRAD
jgi:hypothetical protein